MASTAITQRLGNRTATGMTGMATQIEVHHEQRMSFAPQESGPHFVITHCRRPTVILSLDQQPR